MPISDGEFTRAYERGFKYTANFLQRKFKIDREYAEELSQETWTKVWQHRDQYQGRATLNSYACSIACNVFVVATRKPANRVKKLHLDNLPYESSELARFNDPDAPILVRQLLKHCKPSQRTALVLVYYSGYTEDETAGMTKASSKVAVKMQLHRGKLTIRLKAGLTGSPS